MTGVEGKDVDLYVYRTVAGTPAPVFTACATNVSMEIEAEEINITTADSDRDEEVMGGSRKATYTLEGVVTLDEVSGYQFDDFVDMVGEVERFLLVFTNSFDDRISYDFYALIRSVSSSGDVNDFAGFSVSLTRSGAMTKTRILNALQDDDGNYLVDSDGHLIR